MRIAIRPGTWIFQGDDHDRPGPRRSFDCKRFIFRAGHSWLIIKGTSPHVVGQSRGPATPAENKRGNSWQPEMTSAPSCPSRNFFFRFIFQLRIFITRVTIISAIPRLANIFIRNLSKMGKNFFFYLYKKKLISFSTFDVALNTLIAIRDRIFYNM